MIILTMTRAGLVKTQASEAEDRVFESRKGKTFFKTLSVQTRLPNIFCITEIRL